MSQSLKMRWLITACVWMLAVGLTYWNCSKMDAVRLAREKTERARREVAFQARHAETLNQVRKANDALFLPVPSVTLGTIAVDRQMRALAAGQGLQADLHSERDASADDQVSFRLSARGSLEQVFQLVAEVSKYPYLSILRLHLKVAPLDAETTEEMEFSFRYRILPPDESGGSHLQVLSGQPETGGNPL